MARCRSLSVALLILTLRSTPGGSAAPASAERWGVWEASFTGPAGGKGA
jgi:hypothetical protein